MTITVKFADLHCESIRTTAYRREGRRLEHRDDSAMREALRHTARRIVERGHLWGSLVAGAWVDDE
jgi:hypothetical protein